MALFKILRGQSADLKNVQIHDGFAYFTPDDGGFYIDHGDKRTRINPIMSLEEVNGRIDSVMAEIVQSDWNENDNSKKSYILNRPFYSEYNGDEEVVHQMDSKYVPAIDDDELLKLLD